MAEKEILLIDLDDVIVSTEELPLKDITDAGEKYLIETGQKTKEELLKIKEHAKSIGENGIFNYFLNICDHNIEKYEVLCAEAFKRVDYSKVSKDPHLYQLFLKVCDKYNVYVTTSNHHTHVELVFKARFDCDITKLPIHIIDINTTYKNGRFYLKREPSGMQVIIEKTKLDPHKCTLIDDLESNCNYAKEIGMKTYRITKENNLTKYFESIL